MKKQYKFELETESNFTVCMWIKTFLFLLYYIRKRTYLQKNAISIIYNRNNEVNVTKNADVTQNVIWKHLDEYC